MMPFRHMCRDLARWNDLNSNRWGKQPNQLRREKPQAHVFFFCPKHQRGPGGAIAHKTTKVGYRLRRKMIIDCETNTNCWKENSLLMDGKSRETVGRHWVGLQVCFQDLKTPRGLQTIKCQCVQLRIFFFSVLSKCKSWYFLHLTSRTTILHSFNTRF